MATKTVWWDKDNKQHEGYIQDGKTYTNQELTERVPIGATVNTAGGTYKMTSNGSVPTYATARNNYQNNVNKAIATYKEAGEMQKQRVQSATDASIAEINRQKALARTNMTDANNAARKAYEQAANPFGALEEQRVRLGLDESGFAESSKLRLASDYAAQTNANLRALNEQLQALDVQIAQAKASGQYELASYYETQAQNVMAQQNALQNTLYSTDVSAIAQAQNESQFNEQMAFQKAQAAEQNRYNLALAYLQAGASAPFVAETLGIPQKDVDTLTSMIQAGKATKASGGGSGGGGGKKTNKYYADVADEAQYLDDDELEDYLQMNVDQGKISDNEAIQIYNDIIGSRKPTTSGGIVQSAISGIRANEALIDQWKKGKK